ncbi:MAG: UvrD-helicase domain-containing protein [Bacteroides sp.]|nr:UvrD-helicase domain-containing protein [Bacteroides sp.]
MNAEYLKDLNENQRAAVSYNDGPSLVIAGAGSGKTRVLTHKIAHLLEEDYRPWEILALTFTNKAAREMKERIAAQVGETTARQLWMGTFHSLFLRILRQEASRIGYDSHFSIYDTADSKSLIRSILRDMGLDEKSYKPGVVQSRISQAKNHLVHSADYERSRQAVEADASMGMPKLHEVYRLYTERCRKANAMDFDDLLYYTYRLFQDHPEVLASYRTRFRYVLVDEYQDTNSAQHRIVLQLTEQHRHICVVGDDAQSIYSFRGANIDNILHFTTDFPEARVFKLEQNYRSTQNIVQAANSLIRKNHRQIQKEVFSQNDEGERIEVLQAYSDIEEGTLVANRIADLRRQQGAGYGDFAILYRTNAQSRIFEETLRKRSMPYRIYGGLSFYQRKEVKDVIAYFRLVVNPHDEEAFKRIINYPARGIGNTTVEKLQAAATLHEVSLWEVVTHPAQYALPINKGTASKLEAFRELMIGFMERAQTDTALELGRGIVRGSGIMHEIYQDSSPEGQSRKENIEELIRGMEDFCVSRQEEDNPHIHMVDFLSEVSLLTDQDEGEEVDAPKITLMTVHSAKGLEFRNVFVVGMEEGLFPSSMMGNAVGALEEERRLFYVALTRAEQHCVLSYAKSRYRYGNLEMGSPSRFLNDIDAAYLRLPAEMALSRSVDEGAARFRQEWGKRLERETNHRKTLIAPTSGILRRMSELSAVGEQKIRGEEVNPVDLKPGTRIRHERFGEGEVVSIEGQDENTKARIRFRSVGEKQLLLRFARFTVLD